MELVFWGIVFVASLFVLMKASDYFVESAECIGLSFKIPPVVVGATIIAVGTSLPELVSSVLSVYQNASEFVIGNVVGSNITNILLILGLSALLSKNFNVEYKNLRLDIVILLVSAVILAMAVSNRVFSLFEAIIFIALLVIYIVYLLNIKDPVAVTPKNTDCVPATAKTYAILLVGAIFIFIGAKYTVEAVIRLSEILDIGKEVIAITAVALGTSLPEFLVSLSAIKKNQNDMVIGNIVGSNIFNTFAIMGIPAICGKLVIPESVVNIAIPVMLITTLLLAIFVVDRKLNRIEGVFMIIVYLMFVVLQFLKIF